MLPIILIMPIAQLCVLVFAATYELKDVQIYIADQDQSETSRQLINRFEGNPFFQVCEVNPSVEKGEALLLKRKADLILTIPPSFAQSRKSKSPANLQMLVDAVNGSEANLRVLYTQAVLSEFLGENAKVKLHRPLALPIIKPAIRFWYNEQETYIPFMLPGILCLLITALGMFLSSMSLVREKEIGTIEQINVSPLLRHQFIIGKLFPIMLICLAELVIGLAAAKWAFGIPFLGSFWAIFVLAVIYLILVQSLGMFISSISNTQQQAMFIAWFFLVIFILMSGLFTPVESMPEVARWLNNLNPMFWLVKSVRMVMLKGSGWLDLSQSFAFVGTYAAFVFLIAINRYKKTV